MKKLRSVSEVTKVTDINMNYIQKFIETASEKDILWIEDTVKKCREAEKENIRANHPNLNDNEVEKRAGRQYFGAFRSAFADKYHSELFADKKVSAKKNPLLDAIEKRRAVLGVTN